MADIRLSDKAGLGVGNTTLTGATTLAPGREYRVDSSGAGFTLTLPDIQRSVERIIIVDEGSALSTNNVIVAADGSDTIDGVASFTMDFDNSILEIRADAGTNNWVVVKYSKFAGGEIDTNSLVDTPLVGADELIAYDVSGAETVKRTFANMITDLGLLSSSPGVDDVLGVGQALTAARTIDTNTNTMDIGAAANKARFTDTGVVIGTDGTTTAPVFTGLHAIGRLAYERFGNSPQIRIRRSNGTEAAPTGVLNTEFTGRIFFEGLNDVSAYQTGARISAIAEANYVGTTIPTGLAFDTHDGTTAITRMTIAGDGALNLNSYGSGSVTGAPAYNLLVDASGNVVERPAEDASTITGASPTVTAFPDHIFRLLTGASGTITFTITDINRGEKFHVYNRGAGPLLLALSTGGFLTQLASTPTVTVTTGEMLTIRRLDGTLYIATKETVQTT